MMTNKLTLVSVVIVLAGALSAMGTTIPEALAAYNDGKYIILGAPPTDPGGTVTVEFAVPVIESGNPYEIVLYLSDGVVDLTVNGTTLPNHFGAFQYPDDNYLSVKLNVEALSIYGIESVSTIKITAWVESNLDAVQAVATGNYATYVDGSAAGPVTAFPETQEPTPIDIEVPSSLNINGNGLIPVKIFGRADLDVSQIIVVDNDPTQTQWLRFNGLEVRVKSKGPQFSISDLNADGINDLMCHFVDDPSVWVEGDSMGVVEGFLWDGTAIKGETPITVVNQ